MNIICFTLAAFLSQSLTFSEGYFVDIDAYDQECFLEKITSGKASNLLFEVVEGGFLDIDVKISGPDGKIIHALERQSNGKHFFTAYMDGIYKYCFSNAMSTLTPKTLVFTIDVGQNMVENFAKEIGDNHNKLAKMIRELSDVLMGVKLEQEYMAIRDRVHSSINNNINLRVVMWAFFEAVLLAALSLGQVYYLKRFFEVQRVV